jgi:hypothetical protein
MNEYTFETDRNSVPPPPDFDDERTVVTARPVVPLEEINAKVRHRRQWFLGGAFALAMLLGAATAIVASYFKLRSAANVSNQIATPQITAPLAVPEAVASETQAAETTEEPAVIPTEEPKQEPIVKRRSAVRRPVEIAQPRNLPKLSEDEELQRIRQAVLVDQWQERRARRVTRRERRNQADHHDRNLSNLDEIFEGRKTPNY